MVNWLQSLGLPGADLRENRLGAWAMDCMYTEIAMRCGGGSGQVEHQAWPNEHYKLLFDHESSHRNASCLGNWSKISLKSCC